MDNIIRYKQREACEILGFSRPTLYKRCTKLGINIKIITDREMECLKNNIHSETGELINMEYVPQVKKKPKTKPKVKPKTKPKIKPEVKPEIEVKKEDEDEVIEMYKEVIKEKITGKPKKDYTQTKKLQSVVKKAIKIGVTSHFEIKKGEDVDIKKVQEDLIREVTGRYRNNAIKIQQMSEYLEQCYETHGCYTIRNATGNPMENPEMKSYIALSGQQDKLAKLMTEVLQIQPPEDDYAPKIIM